MHVDHVGGQIASGQLAFPNAIVRVDKREADYWLNEANMRAAPAEAKRFFDGAAFGDSLHAGGQGQDARGRY